MRHTLTRELAAWRELENRHHLRWLSGRLTIALAATAAIDAVGATLMWAFERGRADIASFGDALFFSTVQLLTVSSQMRNPVTTPGRIVDVLLEVWALFVVAALAGSFASFFRSVDRRRARR